MPTSGFVRSTGVFMMAPSAAAKTPITIRLCGPRGFCAGVDRAIQIVVLALKEFGAPVYVRHEIVHNRYVVEGLEAKGAIFVEELDEIPPEHRKQPVVFSAHGVPKSVPADADERNLFYLDATCPLVSKVHKQAMRHHRMGRHVVLIGHAGTPRGHRHHGAIAGGGGLPRRDRRGCRRLYAAGRGQSRFRHADDALGRRYRRRHQAAA